MQLNNSNGRDQSGSTFQPYNQAANKPKFAGDIGKVDSSQFNPQNSNAKAFGVDIFANDNNQNNNPQQKQQSYMNNTNSSPFGNANNKPSYNNRPAQNNNSSPFGSKPNSNNNRPYQPQNNKPAVPSGPKPQRKFAHKWSLAIKFDVPMDQIIITVKDDTTNKTWRKVVGKQETYGKEVKQEYFRIGKIISNGDAKYTYPPNGVGAVQVNLTHGNDGYNFSAPMI